VKQSRWHNSRRVAGLWIAALSGLLALGCNDASDSGDDGVLAPGEPLPPRDVALYESCNPRCSPGDSFCVPTICTEGTCETFEFRSPGSGTSVCSVACDMAADCPGPSSGPTRAFCDGGQCRLVRCELNSADHNQLVAPGMVCFRGEIIACDTLSPTPCSCGCPDTEMCDDDSGECIPRLQVNETCHGDEECMTGYCDPVQVLSGICRLAPGTPCGADSDCDCRRPDDSLKAIALATA
jgi:hypothetical protein